MNNIFSFDLNHFRLWILFAITGIVEMLVIGHCANIPGQHRILFGQGIASDDYIQRKVQSTHPPRMRVSVSPSLCLSLSSLDSSGVPFTQLSIVSMTDLRTYGRTAATQVAVAVSALAVAVRSRTREGNLGNFNIVSKRLERFRLLTRKRCAGQNAEQLRVTTRSLILQQLLTSFQIITLD